MLSELVAKLADIGRGLDMPADRQVVEEVLAEIKANEWVSVEDRMPEDGQVVWISAGKPQYQTDAEFKGGKFYVWETQVDEHVQLEPTVTHWKPITEPEDGNG